jgi:hypothetical protein
VPIITLLLDVVSNVPITLIIIHVAISAGIMLCVTLVTQVVIQGLWLLLYKNRGVVGDHELEIRDDGILTRTPFNESLHRWSGFQKIASSKSYLYVFVTDNNVEYIPLRCFASTQDAERFQDEIQKRLDAAKKTGTASNR